MGTLTRLKVEAKNNYNVSTVTESDEFLLSQSCKLYQDALDLANENAAPCLAIGEATLTGCPGFRSSQKDIRAGISVLDWQVNEQLSSEDKQLQLWANVEFEQQAKKLNKIRTRAIACLPDTLQSECTNEFSWFVRYPKECVLQVSSVVAGLFVDVASFCLPKPGGGDDCWVSQSGLWLQKSKVWRLLVKSYHEESSLFNEKGKPITSQGYYVGLEVELYEPTIASDLLPRMHTLHNACISLRDFQDCIQATKSKSGKVQPSPHLPMSMSTDEIQKKLEMYQQECARIESHHLIYWQNNHSECRRHLNNLVSKRKYLCLQLAQLSGVDDEDFHDDIWYEEMVALVKIHGNAQEQASLVETMKEKIEDAFQVMGEWEEQKKRPFPQFNNVQGLLVGLKLRFAEIRANIGHGQYSKRIQSAQDLPSNPSDSEIFENQHCSICKAEWYRTGPKCRHCLLGDKLKPQELELHVSSKNILKGLLSWAKGDRRGLRGSDPMRRLVARGVKYFEILELSHKEVIAASGFWRAHLDLMNMIDELNACKRPMRLLQEGEDQSTFTEEEKNTIVVPVDVGVRYQESETKQAMALANLRRQKQTLAFLKNQSAEQAGAGGHTEKEKSTENCMVCLSNFDNDKAVLSCGHAIHLLCLEKLKKRAGGSNFISCPLRCSARTKMDDVMIATTKRTDDGSQTKRQVKGSWGTKVTAITADLLSVSDLGEKSIVFSMWEDMVRYNGIQRFYICALFKVLTISKKKLTLICSWT